MTTTIIFVILILLVTSFSLFKLKESSKWTPTKGTILQSEREMVRSSSSAGSDYNLLVQY